jgi:hypothetical protein
MDRNYDDIVIPMALLLKEGCRMNGRIEWLCTVNSIYTSQRAVAMAEWVPIAPKGVLCLT